MWPVGLKCAFKRDQIQRGRRICIRTSLENETVQKKENIEDTKEAEEDTEKTKYSEWGDFRKNVILVAKKELDQKTSIRFEFEPERGGLGGKTHGIKFFIYKDIPQVEVTEEEKKLTDEEKDEIIDQMSEIISEKLKLRDLRAIAEAAKYDLKKIQKDIKLIRDHF